MIFSLPFTGAFQPSFTVLFTIGHLLYLSLGSGLPFFKQICVLRLTQAIVGRELFLLEIFYPFTIPINRLTSISLHHYSQNQFSFLLPFATEMFPLRKVCQISGLGFSLGDFASLESFQLGAIFRLCYVRSK